MKRNSLLVLCLIVFALVLGSVMPVAAQNPLIIWADGERAPLLTELAAQFTDEFGVAVEIQQIGLPEARDQLLVAGPVGEGPDILIIAHDSVGTLVANGAIIPLDMAGMEDSFSEAALDLFTFNGELWGLPYAQENIAFVRNTDLVPDAPATWQEVRAISEELQSSGTAQYGFLIQTGDTYHHYPIFSAFGGYIFGMNDDGSFNTADVGLASEGALAAGEWLAGMYADGLMVPNVDNDVIFALFEQGQLGMFVTGPWFSQRIIDSGVPYAISTLPGAEGGLEVGAPFAGGQGFVISAFSDNQLLAETFLLDFVATTDFMQAIFDQGRRNPTLDGVDTSADPNIAAFKEAGANAIPMPAIPEMGAVWGAAGGALNLISTGADPVATLQDAVVQINAAILLVQSEDRIVGLPGSHQAAVGCPGDWDPACEVTFLEAQGDGIYTLTLTIPAGDYEYKVAMNGGWDENYGANGEANGPNIALSLSEETEVTFTYDDNTNIVTDSVNNP